jgi:hypothetical protein
MKFIKKMKIMFRCDRFLSTHWALSVLCLLSLQAVELSASDVDAQNGYMKPEKEIAWYQAGDTATFKLRGGVLPQGTIAVEGIVRDSEGEEVDRIEVGSEQLMESGWGWKTAMPGYFEVEFLALSDSGEVPLDRSYTVQRKDRKGNSHERTFVREKQGIAVMDVSAEDMPLSRQFGFDYESKPDEVAPAKLVGLGFARVLLQWGHWDRRQMLEPAKGQYNWEAADKHINLLEKNDIEMMGQVTYTPLWASPYPEKRNVNICVVEAFAYAPKNIEDYGDFMEAVVTRYGDRIRYWEIWNEPSIPGGSCYWSDTTENFAHLLKSGYEGIKRAKPDAIVSLGGQGPRKPYHAFYNKLLEMGMDEYWDVLSLHGAWNSPEDYREIDRQHGVTPKPVMMTEWHAFLQGNMQPSPILGDDVLSFRMMKDLLFQLKEGVEKTLVFEPLNLTEKEVLPFAISIGWFTHASGLFRKQPQIEPRFVAVVLANWVDVTGGEANYVREIALDEGSVAIQVDTANGPLLVFWNDEQGVLMDGVRPYLSAESELRDWEGRALSDGVEKLPAGRIYYVLSPNQSELAEAETADRLVSIRGGRRTADSAVRANYVDGTFFDKVEDEADVPDEGWIVKDWTLRRIMGALGEIVARAALAQSEQGIEVVVQVKDAVHVQDEPDRKYWNGDSLQIAFDCEGTGFIGGNTELICALTSEGPVVEKIMAADTRGDLPGRWSRPNAPAKYIDMAVDRQEGMTVYRLAIPWSELYPMSYDPTKPIRVSFAINNNDGSGRAQMLEWGEGITRGKDPAAYGLLAPAEH